MMQLKWPIYLNQNLGHLFFIHGKSELANHCVSFVAKNM